MFGSGNIWTLHCLYIRGYFFILVLQWFILHKIQRNIWSFISRLHGPYTVMKDFEIVMPHLLKKGHDTDYFKEQYKK